MSMEIFLKNGLKELCLAEIAVFSNFFAISCNVMKIYLSNCILLLSPTHLSALHLQKISRRRLLFPSWKKCSRLNSSFSCFSGVQSHRHDWQDDLVEFRYIHMTRMPCLPIFAPQMECSIASDSALQSALFICLSALIFILKQEKNWFLVQCCLNLMNDMIWIIYKTLYMQ